MTQILCNMLIIFLSFWTMEFVAWFSHKYIMHGPLWRVHRDHHVRKENIFERNDLFALIFAIPSWLFWMFGSMNHDFRLYIGIGIAIYGLFYFFIHEVFIHQRINFLTNSRNTYLLALRRAHKMHHKHLGKENGECFGMLIIPRKYFAQAIKLKSPAS